MNYFVIAGDGNRYGPADIATLNEWIEDGRLAPESILEEEHSEIQIAASSVPGLIFGGSSSAARPEPVAAPNPQGNVFSSSGQTQPGPGVQNAYYPRETYSTTTAGNTEITVSWILGGLGLICCCFGCIGVVTSAIGVFLASRAKNLGNPKAQLPLIFNAIIFGLCIVSLGLFGPTLVRSFNEGFQRGLHQGLTPGQ